MTAGAVRDTLFFGQRYLLRPANPPRPEKRGGWPPAPGRRPQPHGQHRPFGLTPDRVFPLESPAGAPAEFPGTPGFHPLNKIKHAWLRKAGVACLGLAAGLVIAEAGLRVLGLPQTHRPHTPYRQFHFLHDSQTGETFYVNAPAADITFHYDSNPRGYFLPGNAVVHRTNALGFRGPDYGIDKPPGAVRVAFFGDSFTFGEGVLDSDTFVEVTRRLLSERFPRLDFQCGNFGVGGYDTADELFLMRRVLPGFQPDAVVLCYVLNDAEPPLFTEDPAAGPVRRQRARDVPEGVGTILPDRGLYRLRLARLVWQVVDQRRRNEQTVAWYRSLYRPEAAGWQATRRALAEFAALCRKNNVPLVVVLFPILYRLDAGHPFSDLHALVRQEVEAQGGRVLDLLPVFLGRRAEDLWVHPTDQHPNEKAHRIAAESIASFLAGTPGFLPRVPAAPDRPSPASGPGDAARIPGAPP